jgi:hypothetical protein
MSPGGRCGAAVLKIDRSHGSAGAELDELSVTRLIARIARSFTHFSRQALGIGSIGSASIEAWLGPSVVLIAARNASRGHFTGTANIVASNADAGDEESPSHYFYLLANRRCHNERTRMASVAMRAAARAFQSMDRSSRSMCRGRRCHEERVRLTLA